jgi:signal peptidase I
MKLAQRRVTAVVLILLVACIVAAVILISTTGWNFHVVTYKSQDMKPTIGMNETIIITTRPGNIRRGDLVIFKYPADQSQRFIKRVVGLPGEVISIQKGRVFVGQKPLEEDYLDGKLNTANRSMSDYTIPPETYYVLGDNRDASNDSRFWGPLSAELIYGRVMFK